MRNPYHPRLYRTELEKEIRSLLSRAKPKVSRDIVGNADATPTIEMYETDPVEVSMTGYSSLGRYEKKMILSPKTTVTTTHRRTS
jgi:hypothetical protein